MVPTRQSFEQRQMPEQLAEIRFRERSDANGGRLAPEATLFDQLVRDLRAQEPRAQLAQRCLRFDGQDDLGEDPLRPRACVVGLGGKEVAGDRSVGSLTGERSGAVGEDFSVDDNVLHDTTHGAPPSDQDYHAFNRRIASADIHNLYAVNPILGLARGEQPLQHLQIQPLFDNLSE